MNKDTDEETINTSDFLMADDTELEFDIGDFNLSLDIEDKPTRYIKPKFSARPIIVDYGNAKKLARDMKLFPGEQVHGIVKGDFIFGDFIEALVYEKDITVENMYLSTLGMSQANIDSLAGMLSDGRIKKLTLVLSNYFYSHEKWRLMKYLMDECDIDNRLDVLIFRNHTKLCLMEISNIRLVLSGSSNLRSSECFEQFILQESPELYTFYQDWFDGNRQYSIIDREVMK